MTRRLLVTIGVLFGFGVAVWAGGALLPIAHEATGSATFDVPPVTLHQIIADRERYPEWWDDDTPTMVIENRPPDRLVTRIVDGLPFGGTWTFEVVPDGTGSRLTITERGEIYNPIFRIMSRYVFGHTATIDRFLTALHARARGSTGL